MHSHSKAPTLGCKLTLCIGNPKVNGVMTNGISLPIKERVIDVQAQKVHYSTHT